MSISNFIIIQNPSCKCSLLSSLYENSVDGSYCHPFRVQETGVARSCSCPNKASATVGPILCFSLLRHLCILPRCTSQQVLDFNKSSGFSFKRRLHLWEEYRCFPGLESNPFGYKAHPAGVGRGCSTPTSYHAGQYLEGAGDRFWELPFQHRDLTSFLP